LGEFEAQNKITEDKSCLGTKPKVTRPSNLVKLTLLKLQLEFVLVQISVLF